MKIIELKPVQKNKIGRVHKHGTKLESLEEFTVDYLVRFGFIIDVIRPNNTPKTKSPDFLINGATWELKTPTTSSRSAIKERFRSAKRQSDKIIFDLRAVKKRCR